MVILAYIVVILRAQQAPLTVDYPDWVYQGVLFHGVLTGHPVAGYALKHYPVPNSLTTVVLGLLDCILPWVWAAKMWVAVYLALAFTASKILARVSGAADWQMIVVLPTVAFLNLDFWWGHISFEMGLCLLLFFFSLLLHGASAGWIAGLLCLLFFTHMEACACGMLLLGAWTWQERRWKRLWAMVPTVALTVWYAVGRYSSGNVDGRAVVPAAYRWGSSAFVLFRMNTTLKEFGYVNAQGVDGGSLTEAIFGRAILLGLIAAGCGLAVLCFHLVLRCSKHSWRRSVWWFLILLLGLAVLLPQVTFGVADAGSRLLLAGVVVAFFAVRWDGRIGTAAAVLSAILCVANLVQFARVGANPRIRGAAGGLPTAMLLFGHVEPDRRAAVYRALEQGQMHEMVFQTGMFRMTDGESMR